jgi:hypothetical protein
MSRLPQIGSDDGTWGSILNDYLSQAHDTDGTLKSNAVVTGTITDGAVTEVKLASAVQAKLNAAGSGGVASVNTRTGAVTLTKADVALGNVDNTADAAKPISAATQTALDLKADTADLGPQFLVLGPTDTVPLGTAAGTVIIRTT